MYRVVDDEQVTSQLRDLPHDALVAYAELRAVLEVAPWSGAPVSDSNRDGPLRSCAFGADRTGLAVYLVLEEQRRVDVVQVAWLG